jgi:Fur family ferric uptake transcriptional regulator
MPDKFIQPGTQSSAQSSTHSIAPRPRGDAQGSAGARSLDNPGAAGPDYIARLRGLGVRVTPQRLLVLGALATLGGHVSADAILQWAAARYPALNLATVYRTLDLLISVGLVAQSDLGSGITQFEVVGESPHHHLVCERCGAVDELDAALLAPLQQRLLERYGFRANPRHVALFGLCRTCLAAADAQRDRSLRDRQLPAEPDGAPVAVPDAET